MYGHLPSTNIYNKPLLFIKGDINFLHAKLVDLFVESAKQFYDLVFFWHAVEKVAHFRVYYVIFQEFVHYLIGLKLFNFLHQFLDTKVCVVDLLDESESFLVSDRCLFFLLFNELVGVFQFPSVFVSYAQSVDIILGVLEL